MLKKSNKNLRFYNKNNWKNSKPNQNLAKEILDLHKVIAFIFFSNYFHSYLYK